EPQRSNMSRRVFTSAALLLFVVMMCCCSGTVTAQAVEQESIDPNYKWKDVKDEEGVTVESLGVPGLLKVGSDVFAVAEAKNTKKEGQGSFTGIASQLLTETVEKKDNTPVEVMNDANTKTQVLEKSTSPNRKVDVSRPTTVVKGNVIYMLVGKYSSADVGEKSGANDGGLLLVKGEVSEESGGGKRIKWSDNDGVSRISVGEQRQYWSRLIGGGGLGVHTDDGTLVFPVEGTKKGEAPKDEKAVSLLIYSSDNAASWTLSKEVPDGGCSDPSVVEWGEDKKLIMMTACDDGRRRVYESGDKGESWTEALGTLSRVWSKKGEKAVRSGFITATIDGVEDNRNVMLVTLPVYSEKADKGGSGKSELHLWLTDNTHIVYIGPVSGKDGNVAASSLLYRSAGNGDNKEQKEELIALYEKKKGDGKPSHSLWSVLLTEQLQRVKDVLATWKTVDDLVSELCPSENAKKDAPTENACSPTDKITAGLVGFLSGNFSENTWRDEYLGVNATVKNNDDGGKKATLHEGSVKFQGAWAEWPVGKQGENQLYHFANYNFTLVATVSIDGEPTEEGSPIPLMGVKMDGDKNPVFLGLSYNKKKKWILLCGGENPKEHSNTWEKDTTHQVVLMLQNGTQGSVYVDGQRVGGGEACALENKDSKEISQFYIGGGERSAGGAGRQEDVSVTVSNVLLYNRPLSTAEIGALNPNKVLIPPVVSDNAQGTLSQSSPAGQPPSGPKLLNGNEGVGGGSTSTSAPSTVTTSLGKEQSVIQLPSGTSSGGNKNVDVASPSDGDPMVGAEAGGAVQGDTPPQTPVDTPDKADPNAPAATDVAQVDPADTTEVGARSGENGETGGRDGWAGNGRTSMHRTAKVKAAALSSS
ncbi:putative trans-sialidase, partial [Trypanosoma cruzi]